MSVRELDGGGLANHGTFKSRGFMRDLLGTLRPRRAATDHRRTVEGR